MLEKQSNKQYIGRIWKSAHEIPVYMENNKVVDNTDTDRTELVKFILSNPWSGDAQSMKVKWVDEDKKYRCRYKVIQLDTLDLTLFGYGETETEAEKNCYNLLEKIESM